MKKLATLVFQFAALWYAGHVLQEQAQRAADELLEPLLAPLRAALGRDRAPAAEQLLDDQAETDPDPDQDEPIFSTIEVTGPVEGLEQCGRGDTHEGHEWFAGPYGGPPGRRICRGVE